MRGSQRTHQAAFLACTCSAALTRHRTTSPLTSPNCPWPGLYLTAPCQGAPPTSQSRNGPTDCGPESSLQRGAVLYVVRRVEADPGLLDLSLPFSVKRGQGRSEAG